MKRPLCRFRSKKVVKSYLSRNFPSVLPAIEICTLLILLNSTTEVLTRAALVRSLTAIPDVKYVMLTINGEPAVDVNGNTIGIMTADMFVDNAGTQPIGVPSSLFSLPQPKTPIIRQTTATNNAVLCRFIRFI